MRSYDVCIIGSGAGGAPVAYELSLAGFKVIVLEKGPYLTEKDFVKDEIAVSRRSLYTPALKDEQHVIESREAYREKFKAFIEILSPVLGIKAPPASFYIWLKVPCGDDEKFAAKLYENQNITVLPGSYLSRKTGQANPGLGYARIALVAPLEECIDAAKRIRTYLKRYKE